MQTNRGIIRTIVIIIIGVAVLAYLGINVNDVVESPLVQSVWHITLNMWNSYVGPAFYYVWNTVIVGFIWHGVVSFFQDAEQLKTLQDISTATSTLP